MTSQSSLAVLRDPAWPALGTDSVAKNARKALIAAAITPDVAASMLKADLAKVPGLGHARLDHVEAYLRRLADARAADAVRTERKTRRGVPGYCPDCGDPHATTARNVFVDLRGQYVAARQPGTPTRPWCDTCHQHHRAVLGMLPATTGA